MFVLKVLAAIVAIAFVFVLDVFRLALTVFITANFWFTAALAHVVNFTRDRRGDVLASWLWGLYESRSGVFDHRAAKRTKAQAQLILRDQMIDVGANYNLSTKKLVEMAQFSAQQSVGYRPAW